MIGKFYLEEAAASMDGLIRYAKGAFLSKATALTTLPFALLSYFGWYSGRAIFTTKIQKTSNIDHRIPIRLLVLLCAFQMVSYIDACF